MPVQAYVPRHAATHVRVVRRVRAVATHEPAEPIKAPGIAALLRRSPHRVRQVAAAAIGAGIVLFVVTSMASAATHPADTAPQPAHPAAAAVPAAGSSAPAAAAIHAQQPAHLVRQHLSATDLTAKPVRSTRKAPATKQIISGLAANGIPNVALNAYRVAATRMAHVDPSCGIDWPMLAGIGREESDHGQFAGAVLNRNGTSTPRIIGPALDGAHSDYIPAPANGYALDGDAKYTHALGPMQFIPQTWAGYGVDANGDGTADIFNINDAALGAARYLCAAGGNLRTEDGRVRAVLAYNHNDQYLAQVLALAQAYRTGVRVTGIPVGNLTGTLPPVTPGKVGAVNPGPPTAVTGKAHGAQSKNGKQRKHGKHGKHTKSTPTGPRGKHPAKSRSAAPSQPTPSKSKSKSSAPKSGSGSPSPSGTGSGHGTGGGSGGGSGASPTPTPTPSPSCKIGIGGTCVVP
jgi:membrane-bound lytic murein transglycosylase B